MIDELMNCLLGIWTLLALNDRVLLRSSQQISKQSVLPSPWFLGSSSRLTNLSKLKKVVNTVDGSEIPNNHPYPCMKSCIYDGIYEFTISTGFFNAGFLVAMIPVVLVEYHSPSHWKLRWETNEYPF